ncbi:uncharacterized protein LOC112089770 [Eutrema salsugineum]|uniref:uncharacterized protein LOC112089770 n=1 Tax=Eutrema salsugineum TaxID=72664 RepID=UPI000CED3959|nr:uncharacterized protein LOC112089770 [Eutrema salsugineum]
MPFGLKNAGATYQRLVNRMFASQLGRTMEVYIDDMLVKSLLAKDHVRHLQTCFEILGMKLNPTKCTFGVTSGEFLRYIVTRRGIEANPKQITAILELPSPTTKREHLEWNNDCEHAFKQLKEYLSTPPILAKPEDGETLYLYIAVSVSAVSSVRVREDRGEQKPIFYTSKALNDAESRYPTLEKLALAVVTSARKLRPYFQSHSITVLTDQPLRAILHNPSQSGRLAKWAIELSEYDIEYKNRTSAKSQVLANFLIELSPELVKADLTEAEKWVLHVDGSSSYKGSGIGIRLKTPTGELLEQSFRLDFPASNNEAEYEALIAGLRLAKEIGAQHLHAFCDSQLPSKGRHDPLNVDENDEEVPPDWTQEIIAYLANGELPPDKWEACRLKMCAARYMMIKDGLFRWSAAGILLICVSSKEIKEIMKKVHEGSGGNHSGGRSLALKIKKASYFWPTMVSDCEKFVAKCERCQRHGPIINLPTELLTTSTAPYPFMRWAMDIIGSFCRSTTQKQFVLVMTDYFTKWVEAEAYPEIHGNEVKKLVWKNIICRQGIPYEIDTDNGSQFTSAVFQDFCAEWKIRLNFSTPRYPQGNGQAEATNKTIIYGLKKRLAEKKRTWSDELDGVLWSHRTTPRRLTGQSPFSLAYGVEALCPAEISIPTIRRTMLTQDPKTNDQMMYDKLDELEEQRDQALLRIQNYQHMAARYYNKKVRGKKRW